MLINLSIKIFRRIGEIFYNLPDLYLSKKQSKHVYAPTENTTEISYRNFHYDIKNIPGLMGDREGLALYLLSLLARKDGDIVEIGSWLGRSTVQLAKACQINGNGKVHAIDTFKGNPGKEHIYKKPLDTGESMFDRFKKNIESVGLSKYVVVHKGASESVRRKIGKIKVKLLFIDACHDYEAVKEDIKLWEGLLQKGGLIALHDFGYGSEGCIKAVTEEIINSKNYKPVLLIDSLIVAEKI